MEDNGYLVFVEVRYRYSDRFGSAIASIDCKKQAKLRVTAEHYMQHNHTTADRPCRFDVVVLDPSQTTCKWIQNAF